MVNEETNTIYIMVKLIKCPYGGNLNSVKMKNKNWLKHRNSYTSVALKEFV